MKVTSPKHRKLADSGADDKTGSSDDLANRRSTPKTLQWCYFHRTFGRAAQHCRKPCDFSSDHPSSFSPPQVSKAPTIFAVPVVSEEECRQDWFQNLRHIVLGNDIESLKRMPESYVSNNAKLDEGVFQGDIKPIAPADKPSNYWTDGVNSTKMPDGQAIPTNDYGEREDWNQCYPYEGQFDNNARLYEQQFSDGPQNMFFNNTRKFNF